jgi:hypothetical protein
MHSTELLTTLTGGIRNTHFFNGRLLTAEDLRVEQAANQQQHQQLGQAIGEGVAYGLEVTPATTSTVQRPAVRITRGLALNRQGETVALPADVDVLLVREAPAQATEAGLFADCVQLQPQTPTVDVGFYLLTVQPASGFTGQAPMVGLSNPGIATGCGSRHSVEGVKFCLAPLPLAPSTTPSDLRDQIVDLTTQIDNQLGQLQFLSGTAAEQLKRTIATDVARLRNSAAHLCFGSETLAAFSTDPFARITDDASPYQVYGGLDTLRAQGGLSASDVPLALLYWTAHGVQFIDMWAVRRRLIQPLAEAFWPLHVGPRRLAEAEAIFLQFQQQLLDMVEREDALSSITAVSRFRYLPSAGYLPVGPLVFNRDTFFDTLETERIEVDTAFLRLLVHQSWFLEPIDLTAPPPLRLYEAPDNTSYVLFMREERQPQPTPAPPPDQPAPTPPPGPTSGTGRINIVVDVREIRTSVGLAGPSFTSGMRLKAGVDIKVWAEDELGNEYLAQFVPTRSGVSLIGKQQFEFDKGLAQFTVKGLIPGTYTAQAQIKGLKGASKRLKLNAGQTVSVVLKMVPDTKKPGGKTDQPPMVGKGDWFNPPWYDKVAVVEKYLKWPWPPEEIIDFDPVVDPPPDEVQEWMQSWADWVKQQHPDAPVNPGDISIYIDQAHTPDATPQNPYAYLVLGDGGAYVPVVLTPSDRTLGRPVSIAKGGLSGVDRHVEEQLRSVGLTDLDVLGASWQGLVADAMGVSVATAGSAISEARGRVEALQDSLQIFSGVDSALEESLEAAGITDAVALANADAQTLATQLSAQGVTLAFAQRLVDEARQTVPAGTWSLADAALGLKEQEVASLTALGIATKGGLRNRTADTAGRAQIANALGISSEALATLTARIDLGQFATETRDARAAATPVTSLVGVNRDSAKALARLNLGTARDLAQANVNVVARVFGGDVAKATEVINAARGRANIPQ